MLHHRDGVHRSHDGNVRAHSTRLRQRRGRVRRNVLPSWERVCNNAWRVDVQALRGRADPLRQHVLSSRHLLLRP